MEKAPAPGIRQHDLTAALDGQIRRNVDRAAGRHQLGHAGVRVDAEDGGEEGESPATDVELL